MYVTKIPRFDRRLFCSAGIVYCIYYCQLCLLCKWTCIKMLTQKTCVIRATHSRIWYQTLAPVSGVRHSFLRKLFFWCHKLAPNRTQLYSVQVSCTRNVHQILESVSPSYKFLVQEFFSRDSRKSRKSRKAWFSSNAANPVILSQCRVFCQNAVVLRFLQEYFVFNQQQLKFIVWQNIYFSFASLLPKSVYFVTYGLNMWPWRQNFTDESLALHVMMVVSARCWWVL